MDTVDMSLDLDSLGIDPQDRPSSSFGSQQPDRSQQHMLSKTAHPDPSYQWYTCRLRSRQRLWSPRDR